MAEYSPQSYNFLCLLIYQLVTCMTKAKTQRRWNLTFICANAKDSWFVCLLVGLLTGMLFGWWDWLIHSVFFCVFLQSSPDIKWVENAKSLFKVRAYVASTIYSQVCWSDPRIVQPNSWTESNDMLCKTKALNLITLVHPGFAPPQFLPVLPADEVDVTGQSCWTRQVPKGENYRWTKENVDILISFKLNNITPFYVFKNA